MSVGVIVGRFQVDTLTDGHKHLIDAVAKKNDKVLICLGVAPIPGLRHDPLNYETRVAMIKSYISTAVVIPVFDNPVNSDWCNKLDSAIESLFPTDKITLYGSRGSFLEVYKKFGAKHAFEELEVQHDVSSTQVREELAKYTGTSIEFRRGVIHSAYNRFIAVSPVADIAVFSGQLNESPNLLLGRKGYEKGGKFRFLGGFFDPINDHSIEDTAKRETIEEAGDIELGELQYIGSSVIQDWRHKHGPEKIIGSFFLVQYIYGVISPNDDIKTLQWVPWEMALGQGRDDESMLIPEHYLFGKMLYDFIVKRRSHAKSNG